MFRVYEFVDRADSLYCRLSGLFVVGADSLYLERTVCGEMELSVIKADSLLLEFVMIMDNLC